MNNTVGIKAPYVIFLGDAQDQVFSKTGFGMTEWRPDLCVGQNTFPECKVDLGLPEMSIENAVQKGARTLLIGTAAVGGAIPDTWIDVLESAIQSGLDIAGGVHTRLNDVPRLRQAAEQAGTRLIDVRVPPSRLPVGTGTKRTGKRLLTVGTDCASGKKYTALMLEKDMRAAGMKADFRASGQTGIMIAGSGIPIDSVVSDFVSGAAELLSPDNEPDHWDLIEGQGGILHPGYSAVSVGLLLGSQPDAFVVCHVAGRTHISGWSSYKIPSIEDVIKQTVSLGSITNPAIKCVAVSINTSLLPEEKRRSYLDQISEQLQMPCVDPHLEGTQKIIDVL